jgi:hypothetical protein
VGLPCEHYIHLKTTKRPKSYSFQVVTPFKKGFVQLSVLQRWALGLFHPSVLCPFVQLPLKTRHCAHSHLLLFLVTWGGLRLSPLGTSAKVWPIVPTPDGRWWRVGSSRWNKNRQGKPKSCPSPTLSTNPTWTDLGIEPGPPRWEAGDEPPELLHSVLHLVTVRRWALRILLEWSEDGTSGLLLQRMMMD